MKPIPEKDLAKAELDVSIPVKKNKLGTYTASIAQAVANFKAAERYGNEMVLAERWNEINNLINEAVMAGDTSALDDLAKFRNPLKPLSSESFRLKLKDGKNLIDISWGEITSPARQPVTVIMIESIRSIQNRINRAPTRREIADEMAERIAIDDTEISRQLTRLGWNDLITPA